MIRTTSSPCMRSHGDPSYPDPLIGSNWLPHLGGAPPQGAQAQAALADCHKYTPAGSETPAEKTAALAETVKFAGCMRSHGEPNFSDLTSGGVFDLTPQDNLYSNSPQLQAAQKVCQSLDPGLQLNVGGGSS